MPLPVAATLRFAKAAAPWVISAATYIASTPEAQKHIGKASHAFGAAVGNAAGVAGEKIMLGVSEAGKGIGVGTRHVAIGAGVFVGGALSLAGAGLSIASAIGERVAYTIRPNKQAEGPIKPPVV